MITLLQARTRLAHLGYILTIQAIDSLKRKHNYSTSPNVSSGTTNYFHTLAQVEKYITDVEQVRNWQQ